jgi:hypothetical protein
MFSAPTLGHGKEETFFSLIMNAFRQDHEKCSDGPRHERGTKRDQLKKTRDWISYVINRG